MQQKDYEVQIIINGKPAREFSHKGKVYIEGRKNTRFSIRIKNNSYSRKLFVPTIDGLSVMNGEEGSYSSGGYIIPGNSSRTIEGWRTSNQEVAEFYFSSPEGSYRKRMKKGNNLGAIGVAVFEENPNYSITTTLTNNWWNTNTDIGLTPTPAYYGTANSSSIGHASPTANTVQCSSGTNVKSLSRSSQKQAIGTGFGDTKESSVISVNFDRCYKPTTIFEILYNTKEELIKSGENMQKEPLYVTPEAFPGQFCKAPR